MSSIMLKILVLSTASAAAQAQPSYKVTPIYPPPGATACMARAVNNFGHVTGWAQFGSSFHLFIYTPTAGSSDLGDMGGNSTYGGYAINDSDVIVGQYQPGDYVHPFLWDGALHDIAIDIAHWSPPSGYAAAINAGGEIGGTLNAACPYPVNFMGARWAPGGGSVTSLGGLVDCGHSVVQCMNNVGDLGGTGALGSWNRPTLWHNGTIIELPVFGSSGGHGVVESINDSRVCVGYAENRDPGLGWSSPCLWTPDGTLVNLNPAGDPGYYGVAKSINNAGLVVGVSGQDPVVWTAPGSKSNLADLIVPPAPPGMTLSDAVGISNTGFVVCNGAAPGSGFWSQAFLLSPCTPAVVSPPVPRTVPTMTPVTFSVEAVGAEPMTYQWRKDGVALNNGPAAGGGAITGSTTTSLSLTPAACPDAGVYDCLITTPCGSASSGGVMLTITGCICTADFNNDGDSGTDADIEAFFRCLAGSCCTACALPDFNGDGDTGTDADIESFFRVLGGGTC
jgi:hypothetical protein